ncbi:hypothetical protein P8625_15950 [Tenacibaculum tangerinum]|uniref:Cytochrome c domain-containing protein n=1 Tax=Tenacibaculum tangerinum TaxID=3038772 RepID=A0ABY8L265_9FLAO|nr:hypothetical protein [Tenacibaculum tangerinum]WGH75532.1 hypothetical protein P8625_15950 [Tenacibaculum tangerinum]
MKPQKTIYVLFFVSLLFFNCTEKKTKNNYAAITDNYEYPTDSTTVNNWIKANNFNAMYKHSWYIWKHLTSPVNDGKLRYQTWSSPSQILDKLNNSDKKSLISLKFNKPNQFLHAKLNSQVFSDTKVVEVVAYNEAAEKYALDNKIFYLSTLKKLQASTYSQIPDFPSEAITIKPVYKIITQNKLNNEGIYTMEAWPGPKYLEDGYPEKDWKSRIYVNTKEDKSNPNGRIDYDSGKMTAENTYYLNDFIHFRIDQALADSYNSENNITDDSEKARSNDIAVLVAMHVGTKEIKRWVWQTFWWSASPLTPSIPSSNDIASAKNGIDLHGAANHYAMDIAYSMVIPAQPYIGGKNEGGIVVGFNPYLESGFGTKVFNQEMSYVVNNGNKISTNLGATSNCMSCHMAAAIKTNGKPSEGYNAPPYIGDRYLSYKDSIFKNRLMLDFAWSIQSNIDSLK